jgi:hypothetical protein
MTASQEMAIGKRLGSGMATSHMQNYPSKTGPLVAGTLFVDDCPRCRAANMTFDVLNAIPFERQYSWQRRYEIFCVCRNCRVSTVFVIGQRADAESDFLANHESLVTLQGALNQYFDTLGVVCLKDMGGQAPPEFVPSNIATAFAEGATCIVTNCFNAAGAMFRLVIDLSTRPLLPPEVKPASLAR